MTARWWRRCWNSPLVQIPLRLLMAGCAVLLVLMGFAWVVQGDISQPPPAHDAAKLNDLREARNVRLNPANPPRVQREVDYRQGQTASWWPKTQAPILDPLVASGQLPPVAERTGPEPIVLEADGGPGTPGGTWHRLTPSQSDCGIVGWRLSGSTLVRWSPQGYPVVPHLAKSWEVNAEKTEWTFHLRKGIRWSDGAPCTADDVLFWWRYEQVYYGTVDPFMRAGGEAGRIEKVDDLTIRFVFPKPHGILLEQLCSAHSIFAPKHFLERFHPGIVLKPDASEDEIKKQRGIYSKTKDLWNSEMPRLWPWVLAKGSVSADPPWAFVRNPYYYVVDTQGRQLPYLDQILFHLKDSKMLSYAAAGGEATMQFRHIRWSDHTLLMSGRERYGYELRHWYPASRSDWTIYPCINRLAVPGQPDTALKQQLLADKRFRQALSLGINRDAIIKAEYNGVGRPAQIDPGPDSPFHSPALFSSYTAYDPERANRLLDDLGLTNRDGDGMRCAADGTVLSFSLNVTNYTGPGPAQLVIDDWAKLGIRAVLRDRERTLFYAEKAGFSHDFTVWSGESEFLPLLEPRNFVPTTTESFWAPRYGIWYALGGLRGDPKATSRPAAQEPPPDLRQAMEWLDQARASTDSAEQQRLFGKIQDLAAENVWSISISTPAPQLVIVNKDLRGVPPVAVVGAGFSTPANTGIETYWLAKNNQSESERAVLARLLAGSGSSGSGNPNPGTAIAGAAPTRTAAPASASWMTWAVRGLLLAGLAGVLMAAIRFPFIARRLLIMVPTLFLISILTFIIIQAPPGDYLSARITELEMTGDTEAIKQIELKKELFRLEDSAASQYCRWVGLTWFTSFSAEDRGLLQGHLGYSMEGDNRPVNDVVGDRILLTVLLSLGSILFTWIIALSAGIVAAVKQHSLLDHVLTALAVLGMCVPNFLLALLLMQIADSLFDVRITGLFSPAYAADPTWSWGKLLDLASHLWLPVVILGVGGTAGMVRIMRGNLLDELRRPYVTTARAKGQREWKLILRYPVRVALNPFVANVGGIFPQMISGGAIVSMVMSLPTIGPMLIQALMTQDMYLAGSLLMVLSALGMIGTLVSDLLLLWLDPRIRMSGGGSA